MVQILKMLAIASSASIVLGASVAPRLTSATQATPEQRLNELNKLSETKNLTVDNVDEWISNKTQELFNQTMTKKEYYKRNWMWIRCRGLSGTFFDVGGSWFGQDGEELREEMGGSFLCNLDKFKLRYVNGRGWGDATLSIRYNHADWCDSQWPVYSAIALAKKAGDKHRRNFYIWNCPGFEDYPNFGLEWWNKPFPPNGAEWLPQGKSSTGPDTQAANNPPPDFMDPFGD